MIKVEQNEDKQGEQIKSKKKRDFCYVCGEPSTSAEHAPPKSFFPDEDRLKVNLTKVPSCKTHNEDTSKHDEYTRNIIAMSLGNNGIALNHFLRRVVKSFTDSPGLLITTTAVKQQVYYKDNEDPAGEIKPTYAFQIDRERIDLVLRKTAYGIFRKKYGVNWNKELKFGSEYFKTREMQTDDVGLAIQEAKKELMESNSPFEGNNKEVFQFQFIEMVEGKPDRNALVMKFYEGFEVWAFPQIHTQSAKLT